LVKATEQVQIRLSLILNQAINQRPEPVNPHGKQYWQKIHWTFVVMATITLAKMPSKK
jgi:hypothetical protein